MSKFDTEIRTYYACVCVHVRTFHSTYIRMYVSTVLESPHMYVYYTNDIDIILCTYTQSTYTCVCIRKYLFLFLILCLRHVHSGLLCCPLSDCYVSLHSSVSVSQISQLCPESVHLTPQVFTFQKQQQQLKCI